MTDFGNRPFHLDEPMLTTAEAVGISGVSLSSLNNWIARGTVDLGTMHRFGRRLFSINDLIALRIMSDLNAMVGMQPAVAYELAKYAVIRAFEMSERAADGKLLYRGQKAEERRYLFARRDGENFSIRVETTAAYFDAHSVPQPVIVIPLDDIVLRTINDAFNTLEKADVTG